MEPVEPGSAGFDQAKRPLSALVPPMSGCKSGEPGAAALGEEQTLRSALAGDHAAFTALYRQHRAAVYRFAWLITGSEAHAADVTQDVFVELMSTRCGYDSTRGSLAAYLCGIARFRAYRVMNQRLQSVEDFDALMEVREGIDAPPLPSDGLEKARALQTLYAALRRLPPNFRDVLILVELQEMSYADAAAITGVELGTVRSRLSRAKAKLAQLLQGANDED